MSGAIRTERRPRTARLYERKVRFHMDMTESLVAETPAKDAAPVLTAGAERHKREKRKSTRKARHIGGGLSTNPPSDEDIDAFFNSRTAPYPKTPAGKTRAARRRTLPTDILTDEFFAELASAGPSSTPCGRMIGMPDITDFSEGPECPFDSLGMPRDPCSSSDTSFETHPPADKRCRCNELEQKNRDLQTKYDALYQEHQKLQFKLEKVRLRLALDAVSAEDKVKKRNACKVTPSQVAASTSSSSSACASSTPALSITSTPSTRSLPPPATAEAASGPAWPIFAGSRTPADPSGMPVRVIDEDYDEGYDPTAARLEQARMGVFDKSDVYHDVTMEETVNQLADDISSRWRIADTNSVPDNPTTTWELPPVPRFQF